MADDDIFANITSIGWAIDGACETIPDAAREAIYYEANSVLYLAFSAVVVMVRIYLL